MSSVPPGTVAATQPKRRLAVVDARRHCAPPPLPRSAQVQYAVKPSLAGAASPCSSAVPAEAVRRSVELWPTRCREKLAGAGRNAASAGCAARRAGWEMRLNVLRPQKSPLAAAGDGVGPVLSSAEPNGKRRARRRISRSRHPSAVAGASPRSAARAARTLRRVATSRAPAGR